MGLFTPRNGSPKRPPKRFPFITIIQNIPDNSMPALLKDSSARQLVGEDIHEKNSQVEDSDMKRTLNTFLHHVKRLPIDFKRYIYLRHVNHDEDMQVPNKKDYRKLEKGFYRTLFKLVEAHQEYLATGGEYMKDATPLQLTFLRLEKCLS